MKDLLDLKFTLIEEKTTDEIEELEMTTILDSFISTEHSTREIKAKINELVQAFNKINKEIIEKLK